MPKQFLPSMATLSCLFQNRELQIMRKLDHCNIVRLRWFFYSSGEKVSIDFDIDKRSFTFLYHCVKCIERFSPCCFYCVQVAPCDSWLTQIVN